MKDDSETQVLQEASQQLQEAAQKGQGFTNEQMETYRVTGWVQQIEY